MRNAQHIVGPDGLTIRVLHTDILGGSMYPLIRGRSIMKLRFRAVDPNRSLRRVGLLLLMTLFVACVSPAAFAALPPGTTAPEFTASASRAGEDFTFSLHKALQHGPVVVYFYPAAYTKGCDLEAHTFAKYQSRFSANGASIIGVSADSLQRLNAFSADPDYCAGRFPVASDPDGKIAAQYDVRMSPPQAGIEDVRGVPVSHGFFARTTFVVNRHGKIVATMSSKRDRLTPDQHVTRALAIVQQLQKRRQP